MFLGARWKDRRRGRGSETLLGDRGRCGIAMARMHGELRAEDFEDKSG